MKDCLYFIHDSGNKSDGFAQHFKVLELSEELEDFEIVVEDITEKNSIDIDYQKLLNVIQTSKQIVVFLSNDFFNNFNKNIHLKRSFELSLGKGMKNFIFVSLESLESRHTWDEHELGLEINLKDKFIFDFSTLKRKQQLWKSFCSQLEFRDTPKDDHQFDVYLSHSWHENGHGKVLEISKKLTKQGLSTWIDEEQIRKSVTQDIFEGVKLSKKFVLFLSRPYLQACADPTTQIGRELRVALTRSQLEIIVVSLDKKSLDVANWPWILKETVAANAFFDFTTDATKAMNFDGLFNRIIN